ncbi:MAG TPA: hypothetical protein VGX70_12970 [Gemmataceae bacterium]|jgi:hypothetical protein|nr:hypothetical protein [Gemmataceae bacterium]
MSRIKLASLGGGGTPRTKGRAWPSFDALDKMLDLKEGATKDELVKGLKDHIVAQRYLMAKFSAK